MTDSTNNIANSPNLSNLSNLSSMATSASHSDALKQELKQLEDIMHDAEQFHTLEEQVADMKRRGIDPRKSYKDWDDNKDDDWGDKNSKDNGTWEPKTPKDLDANAQEKWDGDNGKPIAPPFV